MTGTPTLWDTDPLPARATDPATSKAAARRLRLRKRKAETMRAIAFLQHAAPGSFTTDEVHQLLRIKDPRWERGWVSSRLSQLVDDGLVGTAGVGEGRFDNEVLTFQLTDAGRAWIAEDRA